MNNWIKINNDADLPPDGGDNGAKEYIVTCQWKSVRKPFVTTYYFEDGIWWYETLPSYWRPIGENIEILAWQELPEPYYG